MVSKMSGTNKNVRARKATSTNNLNRTRLEKDCPIAYTIAVIGGRWKLSILALLNDYGQLRYSEIRARLTGISERMLTLQLRELEEENLIVKTVYAEVPVRTVYALTEKGNTLKTILHEMTQWGEKSRGAARSRAVSGPVVTG